MGCVHYNFQDEVDSLARSRGAGGGGDDALSRRLLTELLVLMNDGGSSSGAQASSGVYVFAATNRLQASSCRCFVVHQEGHADLHALFLTHKAPHKKGAASLSADPCPNCPPLSRLCKTVTSLRHLVVTTIDYSHCI